MCSCVPCEVLRQCSATNPADIIGASLSEPHLDELAGAFLWYIYITRKRYTLGSLIRPRAVTRCNLAVSGMYMRDFGKMHKIAYTYCSVGITDLKPLTGTSADQLPHRKSRSLATA